MVRETNMRSGADPSLKCAPVDDAAGVLDFNDEKAMREGILEKLLLLALSTTAISTTQRL